MKVRSFILATFLVTTIIPTLASLEAHSAPGDSIQKDYVSHAELDQEVQKVLTAKENETERIRQLQIKKIRDDAWKNRSMGGRNR